MSDKETLYDLAFRIDADGTVNLEQSAGCGETSYVTLHSSQLRLLAERAGLIGRPPKKSAEVAELERRIGVLVDKFQAVICDDYWRGEILDRIGDGLELLAKLDAICDLALEFDGGRLKPEYPEEAPANASAPKAEGHDLSREVTTSHATANYPKNGTACTEAVPKKGPLSGTEIGTVAQPASAGGEQLGLEV